MAAGDNTPFRPYVQALFDNGTADTIGGLPVNWESDTIKAAFMANTYTPDTGTTSTQLHWDDISANEVSSAGTYPAGGPTIGNIAVTWDAGVVKVDGDDVTVAKDTGSGFTNAQYVAIYKDTGTPATSPLLLLIDLGGTNIGNTTADYVLQWGATGIHRHTITDGT